MATRRIVASEKTILEKDDSIGSSPAANEKSNISPAVPKYADASRFVSPLQETAPAYTLFREVILKLLAFTFAMIVVPIGSYFATVNTIYRGKKLLRPCGPGCLGHGFLKKTSRLARGS